MKFFFASILVLFSLTTVAYAEEDGEIVIIGQGVATSEPETARISVNVTSICYESSREAKNANAVLANRILEVLQSFAQDPKDKVIATGGVNVLRTETIYVGTDNKILCEMKWRATNQLILQTASLDAVPEIQDLVLAAVDQMAINPDKAEQTYGELNRPTFKLYDETMKKLKSEAHTQAYQDARAQFDAFNAQCNFLDPKLKKITPPEYTVYARRDGAAISADDTSTPIIPDDIAVSASWRFEWSFTPAAGCPL